MEEPIDMSDLTKSQIKKLLALTPEDLQVKITKDTWKDDGILCFGVIVNEIAFNWLWAGEGVYAAAFYSVDSLTAKQDFLDELQSILPDILKEEMSDGTERPE